ncbi:MAG: LysR family transcriptional regulator [Pseudomonadales bacterium]
MKLSLNILKMAKPRIFGQLSDIDLRLLRVFRSVVEAGGFSAAELELNIGRSTISRHIKDLEIRLGVTLCRRGRGGFALTDEGSYIYDATLRLLSATEEFRGEVQEVHQSMKGKLVVALFDKTASNPDCHIPDTFRLFDERAPEVSIETYVAPINEIEKGVMDGRFHLGVIPLHRPSASLDYIQLFPEQMYLYCGKHHPLFNLDDSDINKAQILKYKYAGLGYHSPNMEIGNKLHMARSATAYDQEAIVLLIMSGCYLGYLPEHYARHFVDDGLIRTVSSRTFHYLCQFSAITRRSPKPTRILQTFIDCLQDCHLSHNDNT